MRPADPLGHRDAVPGSRHDPEAPIRAVFEMGGLTELRFTFLPFAALAFNLCSRSKLANERRSRPWRKRLQLVYCCPS